MRLGLITIRSKNAFSAYGNQLIAPSYNSTRRGNELRHQRPGNISTAHVPYRGSVVHRFLPQRHRFESGLFKKESQRHRRVMKEMLPRRPAVPTAAIELRMQPDKTRDNNKNTAIVFQMQSAGRYKS